MESYYDREPQIDTPRRPAPELLAGATCNGCGAPATIARHDCDLCDRCDRHLRIYGTLD